jgi:hypothetical protein
MQAFPTAFSSPRGVIHADQNLSPSDEHLLIITTPGDFGGLFEEMSAITPPGRMPSLDALEALHVKYGITTMGPPMFA